MQMNEARKSPVISEIDFAKLGGGALGYVREIAIAEATRLLGEAPQMPPTGRMFALYHADGSPVSISPTREAAMGSAFEHELMPMSVH